MGDVPSVRKYDMTVEQHEKCISYLKGETKAPGKDASAEALDAYVRCAELYSYNGAFNSRCDVLPKGEKRDACQGKIMKRAAWHGIFALFGVGIGAMLNRAVVNMNALYSVIKVEDNQDIDPVI